MEKLKDIVKIMTGIEECENLQEELEKIGFKKSPKKVINNQVLFIREPERVLYDSNLDRITYYDAGTFTNYCNDNKS